MRWWKRERNSTDFGFLSSNGGAVCNTVFRIGTVGAEVKPFSTGLFVFGKGTVGLGLRAFCRVGRKIRSGIRLGRIRRGAWFVLTVCGGSRRRSGFGFGFKVALETPLINADGLFNQGSIGRSTTNDCHSVFDIVV